MQFGKLFYRKENLRLILTWTNVQVFVLLTRRFVIFFYNKIKYNISMCFVKRVFDDERC